jgi:hypothetical protein
VVALGGAQPQFGLVPAGVQAGDAGGFLQQRPALDRLGVDEGADAPLTDHRRRVRSGGQVGEEDLHVTGAHFLAVDPVYRSLAANDSPGNLEDL